MPGEVIAQPVAVVAEGSAPLGATPPPVPAQHQQNDGQPTNQRESQQQQQGKVTSLPHSALARIRDEERAKGRDEAMMAFAKKAGFESVDEFAQAMAALKTQPVATPPAPAAQPVAEQPQGDLTQEELLSQKNARREQARYDRQLGNLQRERDTLAQKNAQLSTERRTLQEALDAKDAEMALREAAVSVGVKDVDYALRLLTRELEGKSEAEMSLFDERAYFTSLRQAKPYLFGEVVQPATTGTGGSAAPGTKPATVPPAGGRIDAMKMTQAEYLAELRKRNLNPAH